jgi:hypothetical protein
VGFREAMLANAPPFLTVDDGAKLLDVMGAMLDAHVDWTRHGIRARWPSYGSDDTLAAIGRDRRILRGFAESAEAYAERLRGWLDAWSRAGNPFEILRQLKGYLTPHAFDAHVVNHHGSWYTSLADGTLEWTLNASNWDWDSETYPSGPEPWCRFWVVLNPPAELWTRLPALDDPALWDGAVDSPGFTVGSTATPEQVAAVRRIVGEWKDEKSVCQNIIVCFEPGVFTPGETNPPNPNGWYGNASRVISGVRTATRSPDAIYWPGSVGSPYQGLV